MGQAGRGIALMLLSTLFFAGMNASVKSLGPAIPTEQVLFFRNLFALLPVAAMVWRAGSLSVLKPNRPLQHVWRAAAGLVSLGTFFWCYARLPLADVIAVSFSAPLFVTALSPWLLGEAVGPRRWAAVVVGFLGTLLIVRPGQSGFDPQLLLVLVATFFYAQVLISVRKLNRTDTPTAIVFWYLVISVAATALALPFVWVTPSLQGWLLLIGLGLFGGVAQLIVTAAFRYADAAVLAPFDYASILWGSTLGWLIWGEVPKHTLWAGAAVLIASGLYIAHREARLGLLGRARRRAPPAEL
ncbi:DMT family transporter [Tistlia consotensis]|uniref:DMT family transporter n=1 Tax=Tistlia consotensis TaxID=1321365 RepID=UPI0015C5EDFF|nr:DMT family transporter [Tistlia consotensis]